MKIVVFHASYGCDTGCCGHVVKDDCEEFSFAHPHGEDPREFAERLVREVCGEEHVADLDWDNCVISNN